MDQVIFSGTIANEREWTRIGDSGFTDFFSLTANAPGAGGAGFVLGPRGPHTGENPGQHYGNQGVPGLPPFHKDPWDGPPNGHSRAEPPFAPINNSVPEPGVTALLLVGLVACVMFRKVRCGHTRGRSSETQA